MSKYALRKKHEHFLSEEAATEQVVDLLEYYDIDVEKIPEEIAGQDSINPREGVERALDAVRDYIRRGVLEVARDPKSGAVVVNHTLVSGAIITYGELTAKAKLAMDKATKTGNYSRIYALMGSLCGIGQAAVEKFSARDLSVAEVLGAVFSNA